MSDYSYGEKEYGLANIINDISYKASLAADEAIEEMVMGEVEKIALKDISLHVIPEVDSYKEIKIFTHRFAVRFHGVERGKYINVLTFHSESMVSREYQAFLPHDFEIVYEDNGIVIESKYVLQDEEEALINFMNAINYHHLFENRFEKEVLKLLDKIGYEVEKESFEE